MAKLSERVAILKDWEDFTSKFSGTCNRNEYDKKTNPNGYVNLGTAVNNICWDILHNKICSKDVWACEIKMFQYCDTTGLKKLRKSLAAIMTEFWECNPPIDYHDLCCFSGATGCMDILGHCLADPGDVFLCPSPMYSKTYTIFMQRSQVDIWPIPIVTRDGTDPFPTLTFDKVKAAYEAALSNSCKVRGLFLINPSNPLGEVYSPELLMEILKFCHAKELHVIVDELFSLSTFVGTKFHSVLKFSSLPDPDRTHVLYGLSKDFSVAGIRIGCIHTKNEELKHALSQLSHMQSLPCPIMNIAAILLDDREFCRAYVRINRERLTYNFDKYADRVRGMGLPVRKCQAGFYLWVDFRSICGSESFAQETHFFKFLIHKHHLFLMPGKEYYCEQPGWLRIVFSSYHEHLEEGLKRLEKAIKEYKPIESPTSE